MVQKLKPVKGVNTGLVETEKNPVFIKGKLTLEEQRERDKKPVKGIFRFHEVPGGVMPFVYKKYPKDPVLRFELKDGEVYTLPLGVAKHLTQDVWYPENENVMDENGKVVARVGRKIRRCSFESLEFMDIEELTPDNSKIQIAENVGL